MSNNEYEYGEFKLPAKDFAALRQKLQEADEKVKKESFQQTQKFWKGLTRKQQTDPREYERATMMFAMQNKREIDHNGLYQDAYLTRIQEDANQMTQNVLGCNGIDEKPRRVTQADMEYPTNRTTRFENLGYSIEFNRDNNTVTWEVPGGNHAVDNARNSLYGRTFFEGLNKVRWTRNTGGYITGSDEYREDAGLGEGCNGAWGPIGFEQHPEECRNWTDPQGNQYKVSHAWDRYGNQVGKLTKVSNGKPAGPGGPGRRGAGTPEGGQFTERWRSDPGQLDLGR